jgi:hypothetical protein
VITAEMVVAVDLVGDDENESELSTTLLTAW